MKKPLARVSLAAIPERSGNKITASDAKLTPKEDPTQAANLQ